MYKKRSVSYKGTGRSLSPPSDRHVRATSDVSDKKNEAAPHVALRVPKYSADFNEHKYNFGVK